MGERGGSELDNMADSCMDRNGEEDYYSKNSVFFSGISGVLEARWVSHAMT